MKQPVLVLALVAAAWLLVSPFLHWLVRWQLDPLRLALASGVVVVLALCSLHAAQQRRAEWSAIFAALSVALNPLWPMAAPARVLSAISISAGVALAIYAIRRWK